MDRKAGDAAELVFVIRHKCGAKVFGVRGDQHVIRADGFSAFREYRLDAGKIPGGGGKVFDVKEVQQSLQGFLILSTTSKK